MLLLTYLRTDGQRTYFLIANAALHYVSLSKSGKRHTEKAWAYLCQSDKREVGCVAQLAERRSLAGELTHTLGLQPTGDHYVGKPSATGQPTRPTQPFILSGSINE